MIYTCTDDYQGGCFGIGRSGDIEYWKQVAYEWDELDDIETETDNFAGWDDDEIIDFICSFWDIGIVEDESGEIGKRLKKEMGCLWF